MCLMTEVQVERILEVLIAKWLLQTLFTLSRHKLHDEWDRIILFVCIWIPSISHLRIIDGHVLDSLGDTLNRHHSVCRWSRALISKWISCTICSSLEPAPWWIDSGFIATLYDAKGVYVSSGLFLYGYRWGSLRQSLILIEAKPGCTSLIQDYLKYKPVILCYQYWSWWLPVDATDKTFKSFTRRNQHEQWMENKNACSMYSTQLNVRKKNGNGMHEWRLNEHGIDETWTNHSQDNQLELLDEEGDSCGSDVPGDAFLNNPRSTCSLWRKVLMQE